MLLQHGKVLNSRTGQFEIRDLAIEGGLIVSQMDEPGDIFDASGKYILPGMIDTHIHGYQGVGFVGDSPSLAPGQLALAAQGVTGYAATIRCMPVEKIIDAERYLLKQIRSAGQGARLLGIHCEGPFVAESRRGAMIPIDRQASIEDVEAMIDAGEGYLKIMTLAPERENACEIIRAVKDRMAISLGHTDATYAQSMAAIDAGASRATHTFNAMRPFSHRETGVLGAVLMDDRVTCEMIADFVHLDPATVQMIYRLKGAERINLVSDTGEMGGCPDGEYLVNHRMRYVKDGVCLNAEGRIAGSCFTMLRGAQNLRKIGVPLSEISKMASENPAKALGVDHLMGTIENGKYADLIVCDDDFHLTAVFVGGVRAL